MKKQGPPPCGIYRLGNELGVLRLEGVIFLHNILGRSLPNLVSRTEKLIGPGKIWPIFRSTAELLAEKLVKYKPRHFRSCFFASPTGSYITKGNFLHYNVLPLVTYGCDGRKVRSRPRSCVSVSFSARGCSRSALMIAEQEQKSPSDRRIDFPARFDNLPKFAKKRESTCRFHRSIRASGPINLP